MMNSEILILLSNGILGLFLGAQITEAVLLVPYWKSLSADDFFAYYQEQGGKIHRFFAPITIAATVLPLFTVGYHFFKGTEQPIIFALMGFATLAFFSTYYLYFKKANQGFAERSIADEVLADELKRWGNWHWSRIGLEGLAFGCALWLLA